MSTLALVGGDRGLAMAIALRSPAPRPDILCLSHLRWGAVYRRPQHVMSRFGRQTRVFFWEEPRVEATQHPRLELPEVAEGVYLARPRLPAGLEPETVTIAQRLDRKSTRLNSSHLG